MYKNNAPLKYTTVIITLNNKKYTTRTDNNGNFKTNIKATAIGTNNAIISYPGNNNFNKATGNVKFIVSAKSTRITINPVTNAKLKKKVTITGTFKDTSNNALRYTPVIVNFNGKTMKVKTNAQGVYTFTVTPTKTSNNRLTVSYNGNQKYQKTSTTTIFKAAKA